MSKIIFLKPCLRCKKTLEVSLFIGEDKKERSTCIKCCESRRKPKSEHQLCEECGKRGNFNLPGQSWGIRCKEHADHRMVNVNREMYSENRFIDHVKSLGGRVVGEVKGARDPVECICKEGHKCKPTPGNINQGGGICATCAGQDFEASKMAFAKNVEKYGGRVVGEYVRAFESVECECRLGHKCSPTPHDLNNGQGMCRQCVQSGGEMMIFQAFSKLDMHVTFQAVHSSIPGLRFDYSFMIGDAICYLEYDGEQHFKHYPFFHKTEAEFEQARQRDLVKNYVCRINNIKLIRLDPKWTTKPLDSLVGYLQTVLHDGRQFVADSTLYEGWASADPDEKTLEKYNLSRR